MLAIGLMSGTSADGIDAALVELEDGRGAPPRRVPAKRVDGRGQGSGAEDDSLRLSSASGASRGVSLRAFLTLPYPEPVRNDIFCLFDTRCSDSALLCRTNFIVGELCARAAQAVAEKAGVPMEEIVFIASHGQTVWHQPKVETVAGISTRSTLQIGEPAVIAERTGCTVVANFRARDIAAGGQGAPLVPFGDYLLMTDPVRPRIAQNIGGIANLTYLPPAGRPEDVIAFDTGPGNAIIDAAIFVQTQGHWKYDPEGRRAASGASAVNKNYLELLLQHEYLELPPPKSTGREMFGALWVEGLLYRRGRDDGMIATLTRFVVESIAQAYERWLPPLTPETEIILSGGGARNPTLVQWLKERVKPAAVRLSDELGLPSDAKEAILFAVLGAETLRGAPSNLPSATGARHPVILGQIIPGRGWPERLLGESGSG